MLHDIRWTHNYNLLNYIKDFSHVYFACQGLPYWKKDQMLFIDDALRKAIQNSKCNVFFIEFFKGHKLLENKVQWLDLAFQL
jgi:hypothetical protein